MGVWACPQPIYIAPVARAMSSSGVLRGNFRRSVDRAWP